MPLTAPTTMPATLTLVSSSFELSELGPGDMVESPGPEVLVAGGVAAPEQLPPNEISCVSSVAFACQIVHVSHPS